MDRYLAAEAGLTESDEPVLANRVIRVGTGHCQRVEKYGDRFIKRHPMFSAIGVLPQAVSQPRLLDRVREAIRRKHYSRRTEETYIHWIKRFIFYFGKRHPIEMGAVEVTAFLNHLASERHVASATQNQALAALLFLYKEALGQALPWLDGLDRVKRPVRLPVVLSEAEVRALLLQLDGAKWLMASLLYGAGLRVTSPLDSSGDSPPLGIKDVSEVRYTMLDRA